MDIAPSPFRGDAGGTGDLTTALLTAAAWLVVGAAVGFGIRRLNVWLYRKEELEFGSERWQVWGPPILCALLFAVFGYHFGPVPVLLIKSLWVAVLVEVIFCDLEHRLILDRVMFPAMVAAIALSFFTPNLGVVAERPDGPRRRPALPRPGAGRVLLLRRRRARLRRRQAGRLHRPDRRRPQRRDRQRPLPRRPLRRRHLPAPGRRAQAHDEERDPLRSLPRRGRARRPLPTRAKIGSYEMSNELMPGETLVLKEHQHWVVMVKPLLLPIAMVVLVGLLDAFQTIPERLPDPGHPRRGGAARPLADRGLDPLELAQLHDHRPPGDPRHRCLQPRLQGDRARPGPGHRAPTRASSAGCSATAGSRSTPAGAAGAEVLSALPQPAALPGRGLQPCREAPNHRRR